MLVLRPDVKGGTATGDIAARRDAVPEASATAAAVLERLPFGVLVVDRDLRARSVNPAARRLLSDGDAAESGIVSANDMVSEYAARLFSDEAPERELVRIGPRVLSINGVAAGGAETAIIVVADVTDLERRERAERQFIENASHELRTPVAAIVSVVEALEAGGKEAPEVRDRFLAHLRVHSTRLVQLSTSLLALARVQSRAEVARVELVPLRTFVENVAAQLHAAPGVSIVVDIADTDAVLADPDLLRLAIENVAGNAIKYTLAGEVRFVARAVSRWTELEIQDTGPGMSGHDRDYALARFHRGGDHGGVGFGLGLAIAADAIEATGGTLRVDSAPGEGASVRIRLPAAKIH